VKYVLFGIGDENEVLVAYESTSTISSLDISNIDMVLLCVAEVKNVAGTARIQNIQDVRFPYTRSKSESIEIH
jgi:hypothetical protein